MVAASLQDHDEEVSDGDDDPELLVWIMLLIGHFPWLDSYV